MVKNLSPPVGRRPATRFCCRDLSAKTMVNSARARLIALWPCGTIRRRLHNMVNKEYPPYLTRAVGGSGERIDVEAMDQLCRPRHRQRRGHAGRVRPLRA